MKKIYIQPETEIVILSEETIFAASEFNPDQGTQGVDGSAALTKERGDWEIW